MSLLAPVEVVAQAESHSWLGWRGLPELLHVHPHPLRMHEFTADQIVQEKKEARGGGAGGGTVKQVQENQQKRKKLDI